MSAEEHERNDDRRVNDLVSSYIDRMNAGERITAELVMGEEPLLAGEILDALQVFFDLDPEPKREPLGTLGDYTLRRRIGRGGMGVVYEAWQNSMDRRVALKILPAGIAADDRAFQRFMQEARAAGKLSHPNIVAVHAMGQDANTPYYAMEFIEGDTLAQILVGVKETEPESETPFGKKDSLAYYSNLADAFAEVADGLQHAHSKKVIHRDIKPSNLIFDREGRLRILDFGLARLEGQESLTLSGDFLGTPHYMSPEQSRRKRIPVDHRTDVYSLGATMYEALCGRPPFQGKDHADTLAQIIERDPVEPKKLNTRVPREFETIVLKCLRKEAADRYGTAEALGQDLRRFVRGEVIEARGQGAWDRLVRRAWRNRLRLAGTGAALMLFLAAALLLLIGQQRTHDRDDARYRQLVVRAVGSLELGGLAEPLVNRNQGRSAARLYRYLFLPEPGPLRDDPSDRRSRSALYDLEEAVRLFPRRPDARYHLARGRWLLGQQDEALRLAEEALSVAPRFGPLRALKAALLSRAGKNDLAERELDGARRLGSASWTESWQRAQETAARGEWAAAAGALGDLVARERTGQESYTAAALELRLGRGLAYLEAGDFEKARLDLAMAHERWPEALAPAYLIGRTFVRQGKSEEAAAWFQEHQRVARREEPEVFSFIIDLLNKDFETLILWVEAIPESPARDRVLTCLLLEGSRTAQSLGVALQSVAKRPEDPVDLALLAMVKSCCQGREREARTLLARIEEKGHYNAAVCVLLGVVCASFADHVERERWGRRLLALDPGSEAALVSIADSLQARGKPQEAVEVLEEAQKQRPLGSSACNLLGFIHLSRRDLDAADQELRRAMEMDSEEPFILSHLGLVQHGRRRIEEAESLLRKAMRLWPYYQRAPGFLAVLLEEQGRFGELPALLLRALKDQNDHLGAFPRNVHRCLQDLLRGRPRLPAAPELDEIAQVLEASVAAATHPPHFLQSLALVFLYAPGRRDLERSLSLAREAAAERPRDPVALSTLATVHAARAELAEAIRVLEGSSSLGGELLLQLEEYRRSYLPSLASYASADWALESTHRVVLIPAGADWRYLVAASGEVPPGWTEAGFSDMGWNEGPSGFGYGGGDDATVLDPLPGKAVHIRRAFTVAEPERCRRLRLRLEVDGAYAVWLNGREMARGVADPCAGMRRRPHVILEIRPDPALLRPGQNLMALRAQDAALWSRGLSLTPVLEAKLERDRAGALELRDGFATAASGVEAQRILAYLDARILEWDGRLEEAAQTYDQLAGIDCDHPEPHLQHVGRLLAASDAAQAEEHLGAMLAAGLDAPALWDLWARVCFRDLHWSAGELLARLPAVDSAGARDLQWICERLESDGEVRINCGSDEHINADGMTWAADRFFTSGAKEQSDNDYVRVAGTVEQPLFKVGRSFPPLIGERPGYRLPLPRGRYRLALHFAEVNFDFQGVGRRVFDVVVEGKTLFEGYDAVARVGFGAAESLRFEPILVEDGRLEIEFVHRVRDPMVSGVEVERVE